MSAVDRVRALVTLVPPAGTDGARTRVDAENNKRTERFMLRVTGQVDITVAGTGLRNRGSILAAMSEMGFTDAGADKVVLDPRLARFIAEYFAPSALPALRLGGAGVQAATLLNETVPLWLAAPNSVNPNDTKYVEVNKQSALQVFINPNRTIGRLVAGAPTGTITNLQATVQQVFDDLLGTPPMLTCYTRQLVQTVAGTNAALKIDLRGSRYIRAIAIQQDTDQGEDPTLITGVVLRGDAASIIGDRTVPYVDLQEHSQELAGGAVNVAAAPGYLLYDFMRYGRLSTFWNPYQDTNLRLELAVNNSTIGGTNPVIRVAVLEYERTAATMGNGAPNTPGFGPDGTPNILP